VQRGSDVVSLGQLHDPDDRDEEATAVRPSCGSCRFWKPHAGSKESQGWGQCKRMPPALPEIKDEKLVLAGIWPSTDERDWCGEYEAAAIPVDEEAI
jgi:hypothetical protein